MASKNKLERFKDNESFENVIQPTRIEVINGFKYQGKWSAYFGNKNPITLELGCGKGEYTIALAKKNPERNFIGIDIKGARFWKGAKTAVQANIKNVAFIRTQIELIDLIFAENEINEIWITFPDPQIKYKRIKHCLTNSNFLKKYHSILQKKGLINLKTDSEFVHGYTLGILHSENHQILYANHNVYKDHNSPEEVRSTQTFYEKIYLAQGKPISYIKFKLKY
ncbi:MAG: tRNA (guanosine(46)-N7)-methyltransferase TrmB [Tenacibaculum sp.]